MAEERTIDWASTEVDVDRTLTVALTGKRDKEWRTVFDAVAQRLAREGSPRPWSELTIKTKGQADCVIVSDLDLDAADYAEQLGDHLAALVAQANATIAAREPPEPKESERDPRERAAEAATEAFRRLAREESGADRPPDS